MTKIIMIEYVKIHHFYKSALMRSVRLILFGILVFVLLYTISSGGTPKFSLFVFYIFVMLEVFFHFKIVRVILNI